MNQNIKKIWNGFLTGMGFSVAFVTAIYAVDYFDTEKVFGKDSGLEVINLKEKENDYGIDLIGKVKNNGEETWNYVKVGVNFFDETGEFVDSFEKLVDGTLPPGEEVYFKVSCGWENKPIDSYKEYKVFVTNAYNINNK
jgi:hypothetical protein